MTLGVTKENEAKMTAAQKACEKFAPVRQADPQQAAEDLDRMTKLARCLRRNGVPVEDPKPGKPFMIKTRKGNEAKSKAAMKTCSAEAGLPEPGSRDAGATTQMKG